MENTPKRTPVLWILGILTMLSAASSTIAYLSWAFAPDQMLKSMEIIKEMNMFSADQVDQLLSLYTSIKSWQYLLLTIVQLMLFAGAFLMLVRLNNAGFHVYTIGKILEFCVMNFAVGGLAAMNLNGIIMSVLWVLMYATQLRFLQPSDNQNNNNIQQSSFPNQTDQNQTYE